MPPSLIARRASYCFLCAGPFLAIALVAVRALRVPVLHVVIGVSVFAMFATAIWQLGGRAIRSHNEEHRLAVMAGTFLVLPFALMALLWVGLGPPWVATAPENQMRYVVLVTMAAAVVGGFATLKEALHLAGERFYSTLGFAGIVLASPFYLVGESLLIAAFTAAARTEQVPDVFRTLSEFQDILLFLGGVLTYASAAAFALSMRYAGWLGGRAAAIFVVICLALAGCLVLRGLQFPDPAALSLPWYTLPGFIAGVPAVPFVIPCLLGVVLLGRAERA